MTLVSYLLGPLDSLLMCDSYLVSTEAIIPSETSVMTARERRERLRKTGVSVEEEFISLSVVRRSDEYQGPHPESRLMREEDDLGEGDDGWCFLSFHLPLHLKVA